MTMHATSASALIPPPSDTAHVSKRKQQRALQLVGWIEPLQLHYPEFAFILEGAIEDLQQEAKRNPEADNQLVLRAVHSGFWTISDLLDELPIKRKQLQAILDRAVAAKILITKIPEVRSSAGGRPETLYLPAPNSLCK